MSTKVPAVFASHNALYAWYGSDARENMLLSVSRYAKRKRGPFPGLMLCHYPANPPTQCADYGRR